jgi:hypothetical protein
MDLESTEKTVIVQMNLVRRVRYCAPIAEGKFKAAEVGCHPENTIYPPVVFTQPPFRLQFYGFIANPQH